MKRLLSAGLGALVVGISASVMLPPVSATPITVARLSSEITPYDLVSSGYQGRYKSQGIPSAQAFLLGAQTGKVTATKLIEAGIAMERLADNKLDDQTYVRAVQNILTRVSNQSD